MDQGSGHQKGLGELRLNNLGRTPLRRTALELVAVTSRGRLDRHCFDIIGPLDLKLCSCSQRGVDRRVQRPAAGIGLIAQSLSAERRPQVAKQN
jgi:hypothetical protein